jgi:hypothetical protein
MRGLPGNGGSARLRTEIAASVLLSCLASSLPSARAAGPLPGETGRPGQWAPGLLAEIHEGEFGRLVASRIDPGIDFDFGAAGPDPGLAGKQVSIRWTGLLFAPQKTGYVFELLGDQRITADLDGSELVADDPALTKKKGKGTKTLPCQLEAGLHRLKVEVVGRPDRTMASLRWLGTEGGKIEPIPEDYLFHEVPEPGKTGPPAKLVSGLRLTMFGDREFKRKLSRTVVAQVGYDFSKVFAEGKFDPAKTSVRVAGHLLVGRQGEHGFAVEADGTVRLEMDGEVLFDAEDAAKKQGKKTLAAGFHEFVIEHLPAKRLRLRMGRELTDSGRLRRGEIPPSALFHEPSGPETIDRRRLAPGLEGRIYASPRPGAGRPKLEKSALDLSFKWETDPAPGVVLAGFSGVWGGVLLAPESGTYSFRVGWDGGVQFKVNGRPLVREWGTEESRGDKEVSVRLRKGRNGVELAYFNLEGEAKVGVHWAGPGFGYRKLGGNVLAHRAGKLVLAEPWTRPPQGARREEDSSGRGSPRPAVDLVKNGGFEEKDPRTGFAKGWERIRVAQRNVRASVRVDGATAHGGERSVVVRLLSGEATPGVLQTLSLEPGTYEVRYWASADVDEGGSCPVRCELAGERFGPDSAGFEWRQFRHTVFVERQERSAALKLFIEAENVRVWFDDVEVAVRR